MNEKDKLIQEYLDKAKLRFNLIQRGDSFALAFAEFTETPETMNAISRIFTSKRFKASRTGASYRVINSWVEKGLINPEQYNNGWRIFSLLDLVWFEIALKLRNFGYSLKNIKKIKEIIWNPKDDISYIMFMYYISQTFITKQIQTVYFIATDDGRADIATIEEIENSKKLYPMFKIKDSEEYMFFPDCIEISVNQIIQNVFKNLDLKPAFNSRTNITNQEANLLLEIRNKKYESIELKFKDGEIDMINGIEILDPNQRVSEILKEHDFQDIEIKKQQGDITLIRRKIKTKIKTNTAK